MIDEFAGHLITFDKKGEGDEIMDENILLEVTNLTKYGKVEIAYTDRNERVYVSFQLSDLMQKMCETHVTGE